MGSEFVRGYFVLAVALAAAIAPPIPTPAQTPSSTFVAFVHASVIDGTGAPAKSDYTVIISRDRITAVVPSRNAQIPRRAQIIDAGGKFLIPGLWDSHVHTRYEGIDHLRLLVANGITSARNMSAPWQHLSEIQHWRNQINSGTRVGPQLLTAGPLLDGPGTGRPTIQLIISTPEEGRVAVRRVKSEGADFVKVYNLLSRESYNAIAEEAKAQRIPFVGHVPFTVSVDEASDAGQLSIEHLDAILWSSSAQEVQLRERARDWRPIPGVISEGPVPAKLLLESFSVAKLRALAERLKNNHTAVVPTLSIYSNRFEGRDAGSMITASNRLQYVPLAYVETWERQQRPTSENNERLQFEQCLTVVRELHKAGVAILAGTDVGTQFQVPGISLHDELSLLVRAGLSEMDALQAATRNPARVFHLPNQGTIEIGKRADLVLLDANPLEAIDNTRRIRAVVADGRVFDRNELDTMLMDIRRDASEWAGSPTR
jgi:imidazolonepropionase-like amidohydrolase